MVQRESFLFKKPMTGYVTMLVLSWTLSKPLVRVVKSFTFRFNDVCALGGDELGSKNIVDRFFKKQIDIKNIYVFHSISQLTSEQQFKVRRIRNVNCIPCISLRVIFSGNIWD